MIDGGPGGIWGGLGGGLPPSTDGLDGALEVAGGLELQLVGHGVDLETVKPVGGSRSTVSGFQSEQQLKTVLGILAGEEKKGG